jgi:Leucine-rich repeat (LRR) protein
MFCLQELLLERNELQDLPPVLHELHALKRLLVSHNCLKKVPPSVYALSKLEELQLHQNFLWIQEGEQEQDKVTAVKLTLWLKKLRSLTYQPQKNWPSESSAP